MRSSSVLLLFLPLLACGGAAEPPAAPVVIVPEPTAPPPPPPPPLPAEPEGLVTLSAPAKVCEVSGALGAPGIDLTAVAGGSPFGRARDGTSTLIFGERDTFAEVQTPSWTMRGIASSDGARVHAARWLSFGGVLFAAASDRLEVKATHDGKLVLAAPDVAGFTLAPDARTTEAPCDSVAVYADAIAVLRQDPPAPFLADKQEQRMLLKRVKPVPVSADVHGTAAGTIDADDHPANVAQLERRGGRARIRWGHLAGWVDASLLSRAKPLSQRQLALREAVQFGMIGLLGTGAAPAEHDATPPATSPAASPLVCPADVRIVAAAAMGAGRFVVGSIPAGKPVRVTERGPELSTISLDGGAFTGFTGARLAVPSRDIAAGCTPAPDADVDRPRIAMPTDLGFPEGDAIDALGGEGPTPFGPDSLGGHGGQAWTGSDTGGFGIGSIGTIGHGAGTGGPSLRQGATQVNGRLPPEVIQRIVRQNFGRFRLCYENGLKTDPKLAGRVTVKFQIDASGAVASVADGGSDLPSPATIDCVVRAFSSLSFPQPEGGVVNVLYPIVFSPGQAGPAKR
jgi:hypothetical protein